MIFFDEMLGASSSPQSYRALAAEVLIIGPAKRKSIVIGDGALLLAARCFGAGREYGCRPSCGCPKDWCSISASVLKGSKPECQGGRSASR